MRRNYTPQSDSQGRWDNQTVAKSRDTEYNTSITERKYEIY